jgi:hypothetical protein
VQKVDFCISSFGENLSKNITSRCAPMPSGGFLGRHGLILHSIWSVDPQNPDVDKQFKREVRQANMFLEKELLFTFAQNVTAYYRFCLVVWLTLEVNA